MDTFLDLEEIVKENKRQESIRINIFKEILNNCFVLIRNKNKLRLREMHYNIPLFIMGKPLYDATALRNYLVHHLTDNGLKVVVMDDWKTLYISWKETDIDLDKFRSRKTVIDNKHRNTYMLGNACDMPSDFTNTMKFRQAKQREIQNNRERRFEYQSSRFPQKPDELPFKRRF